MILVDFQSLYKFYSPFLNEAVYSIRPVTNHPIQIPNRPRMTHLPALKLPTGQFLRWHMTTQQGLDFIGCSRSQTRDIAVIYPDEGDDGDQVGEEEVAGRIPEVVGRDEHGEGPEEADEEEGGEVAGLEFEDAIGRSR